MNSPMIETPYGHLDISLFDLFSSTNEEIALSQLAAAQLEKTSVAVEAKELVLDSIRLAAKIGRQMTAFTLSNDRITEQLLGICRAVSPAIVEQFEFRINKLESVLTAVSVQDQVAAMLASVPTEKA